ncbi:MAG: hypothetical protein ACREKB_17650, partial [Candidatus Rokuibacteriota bacterium]
MLAEQPHHRVMVLLTLERVKAEGRWAVGYNAGVQRLAWEEDQSVTTPAPVSSARDEVRPVVPKLI